MRWITLYPPPPRPVVTGTDLPYQPWSRDNLEPHYWRGISKHQPLWKYLLWPLGSPLKHHLDDLWNCKYKNPIALYKGQAPCSSFPFPRYMHTSPFLYNSDAPTEVEDPSYVSPPYKLLSPLFPSCKLKRAMVICPSKMLVNNILPIRSILGDRSRAPPPPTLNLRYGHH